MKKIFLIFKNKKIMYKLKDDIVQKIIDCEVQRQEDGLEMIASENYVSKEVMMACSNVFTNKYSEGYVGKRYYGGQENVDQIELLAQQRALKIFNLDENVWHVNVQALSGGPANLAVYLGVLNPGDTILSMDLSAGGHLSHGHKLNGSGIYYNIISYGVKKDDYLIDYDDIEQKALKYKPSLILAGFSAYPREIDWNMFNKIANKVQEKYGYKPILMADIAHIAGLIAGGVSSSPFPYFDIITSTTHKTLRGPRGGIIFCKKEFQKNIDRGVFPGIQGGPHENIIVAKAVAFGEILNSDFKKYTENVIQNAKTFAYELQKLGWNIITGGTDNHIVLMDITTKNNKETGLGGKIAEENLDNIGISCNKNVLPFDNRKPMDPSGIRFGTSAITSRGLGQNEIISIAQIIDQSLSNINNPDKLIKLKREIKNICSKFPLNY
ncbi:serine hydroxymethyltransferase [Candidatus Vampirococcus lugosii]|uniref:Serine hydroxymethyltransferase n=2 Tax=Candidatus Vampirococcus lugosii TaxID=2789015 RepID=A0ABS5QL74_9BACT|nr:serine hydroxymethyltransferase [Candidatus Vampirococcus lugosii]